MIFFALLQFVQTWLPWLAPLVVSSVSGGVAGFGSFRFRQGAFLQRISTVERDVQQITAGLSEFVTRNEFELLLENLREIKTDLREVRRSLTRR